LGNFDFKNGFPDLKKLAPIFMLSAALVFMWQPIFYKAGEKSPFSGQNFTSQ